MEEAPFLGENLEELPKPPPITPTQLWLRRMFCLMVIMLAVWRFSENSADPDLWGHVLFGQRIIASGELDRTEPFSWTARGQPWINHELGAEIIMAGVHKFLGGPGLLLLTFFVGMLTFWLALRQGLEGLEWPQRGVAWAVGLLVAQEIAFGFAMRPQIFTGLGVTLLVLMLRRIHEGKHKWGLFAPLLFLCWINLHGGALAGLCLLLVATATTASQFAWARVGTSTKGEWSFPLSRLTITVLWLTLGAATFGLLSNPWGADLIRWLIASVLWPRPEITEWRPLRLDDLQHVPTIAMFIITGIAMAGTRRRRWWWETALLAALALAAIRHVRHVPLFGIAALAIVPSHLADALERFRASFENIRDLFSLASVQRALTVVFAAACLAMGVALFTYDKQRFYTIEVPRKEWPLAAIEFIRAKELRGNLLSFFDWGELCLWELPECPVSIDGRLDTCYSRDLIEEHWNFFYYNRPINLKVLDLEQADLALLRVDLSGVAKLREDPQWQLVYQDRLAVVFVRGVERFPKLQDIPLPVTNPSRFLERDPFPRASQPR